MRVEKPKEHAGKLAPLIFAIRGRKLLPLLQPPPDPPKRRIGFHSGGG